MTDRMLVLGAGGAMGYSLVSDLAQSDVEIVAADLDPSALEDLEALHAVETTQIDVTAPSAKETLRHGDFDVVINTVGPFIKFGPQVQKLAIEAGVDYIDISDDAVAAEEQLEMHEEAADAGVTCIICCGASPGITNLLAMHAVRQLDNCTTLDLDWVVPAEDADGDAAIQHLLHGVTGDHPQVRDGLLRDIPAGTLRKATQFPRLGRVPTVTTGHPEPVTLVDHVDVPEITLRGATVPVYLMRIVLALNRIGLFATSERRERLVPLLREIKDFDYRLKSYERRPSAFRVEAVSDSETVIYAYSGHLGPTTAVPASVGAQLLASDDFETGVYPPEAVFDPERFLSAVGEREVEFHEWREAEWSSSTDFS